VNVSARAASRAGTATSATVTTAPTDAATANAIRQSAVASNDGGPSTLEGSALGALSRSAQTAPNTVEDAAIHVAHAKLATQVASVAPFVDGSHAMMPSP
jgi:hypothetical protein